ncbi:MAG TPA: PAS domain S-box protein [Opitutaceae bacterium]|nr:PAS domain S-box protein [Opitutaceae bacterium]
MRLLLVEDNPADVRLVRELLAETPERAFELVAANRLDAALEHLRCESFDTVLLDLGLPDSQGMRTLERTLEVNRSIPIVVLTGLDDDRFAVEVVRAGAQDYLVKGRFDADLLFRTIRYAIERKRAEEKIRHLAAIVDGCSDAIVSGSVDGMVLSWNGGAERMYGYTAQEMIGQPVSRIVPPNRGDEFTQLLERLRKGETVTQFETVRRRKDGAEVNVILTLSAIRDPFARLVAVSAIASDITARKRTEAALERSNAELRRFNQLAVGRELKIVELKQEVNALSRELGRQPPYPLHFLPPAAPTSADRRESVLEPGAIPDPEQEHVHETS